MTDESLSLRMGCWDRVDLSCVFVQKSVSAWGSIENACIFEQWHGIQADSRPSAFRAESTHRLDGCHMSRHLDWTRPSSPMM